MSKIICDICGTSYADTADQCPICGCVRPAQTQSVPDNEIEKGGYTFVKGGRFSKQNVKKRTNAEKKSVPQKEKPRKSSVIPVIIIVLLGILLLAAVLWFTGVFGNSPFSYVPTETPAPTDPTPPADVACEAITIVNKQFTLLDTGDTIKIDCRKIPTDSTDEFIFISENEEVAIVDSNGTVTAIGNGITNIQIICGNVTETCEVTVGDGTFGVAFALSCTEITFTEVGETKLIYEGPIPVNKISWQSNNEFIASVADGVVTANASGPATITASYGDQIITCEVLCEIESAGNQGGITEDGSNVSADTLTYEIYASFGPLYYGNDITVNAGEDFVLYLKSNSGKLIDVDWSCAPNDYISVNGGKIKALKTLPNDYIIVKTEYENKTYSCIIRIR